MKKMEEGRCGMKDPRIQLKLKRRKRYVLYGTSWNEELKADVSRSYSVFSIHINQAIHLCIKVNYLSSFLK